MRGGRRLLCLTGGLVSIASEYATAADFLEDKDTVYRDLPFPGYRIGDDGTVWSSRYLGRSLPGNRWKRLKGRPDGNGYLKVAIYINDKPRQMSIARLVLETFVGKAEEGMQACHFPDKDKRNNKLSNLIWGTNATNYSHRRVHGTDNNGKNTRLTSDDVLYILEQVAIGRLQKDIAKDVNCHPSTVYGITCGRVFGWLTGIPLHKKRGDKNVVPAKMP